MATKIPNNHKSHYRKMMNLYHHESGSAPSWKERLNKIAERNNWHSF